MEEQDTSRLLVEYETLRNTVEATQQNLEILAASIRELEGVKDALEHLKDAEAGSEAYVPLGGDSFIKATLVDTGKVVQGIGANVAVKRPIGDAVTSLGDRIKRLQDMRTDQEKHLSGAIARLEEMTPALEALAARQGQGPGR